MATVGTMISNISLELKDTSNVSVSSAAVVTAINRALNFYKWKPFWFNEFYETRTISSSPGNTFTLSTTKPVYIFPDGGVVIEDSDRRYPLRKVSSDEYDSMDDEGTGRPFVWTYRNEGYEVYYYADQNYTAHIRGVFDYNITDFSTALTSSSTLENVFTVNAPTLIEYDALSRLHFGHLQDENMGKVFRDLAERELGSQMEFDREKNATGQMQVHSCLI